MSRGEIVTRFRAMKREFTDSKQKCVIPEGTIATLVLAQVVNDLHKELKELRRSLARRQ